MGYPWRYFFQQHQIQPASLDDELLNYPNPALEKVCFRYSAKQNANGRVKITNLEGKIVLQSEVQIAEGLNTY